MNKPGPARKGGLVQKLPMLKQGRATAGMGSLVFRPEISLTNELKSVALESGAWKSLARYYLRRLQMPRAGLGLLICGDARSRALNLRFRRKDRPTDVLSFPLNEGRLKKGFAGELGDVAINLPYARRKLGRFAPTLHEETAFLFLHGILHLSGYHHDSPAEEARMWRLSRSIFPPPAALSRRLRISRPKAHVR